MNGAAQERTRVSVYDPVFNEADVKLLEGLDLRRLAEDRAGVLCFIYPITVEIHSLA
jgi:hypothetical protein